MNRAGRIGQRPPAIAESLRQTSPTWLPPGHFQRQAALPARASDFAGFPPSEWPKSYRECDVPDL